MSWYFWLKYTLKGQYPEIFYHFFCFKDSTWASYEQANPVLWNFAFSPRYSQKLWKNVCPHCRWLRSHCVSVDVDVVSVVKNYADTCQRSQQLRWHMVNYFTLEKGKTKDEKNITWYFLKLLVPRIVIDYALTCWNSRWQRRHDVAIVIDYADKMSVYPLSTVRGHRVRV